MEKKIYAPAKVNLCLDVIERTSSGYHEIQTIFYETNILKNEITITHKTSISPKSPLPLRNTSPSHSTPISPKSPPPKSPPPEHSLASRTLSPQKKSSSQGDPPATFNYSLAHRAYELLKKRFDIKESLKIEIKREIPVGSGLGGESSNAAAMIKYLNDTWKLGLSTEELMKIGKEIGMDVPFFIVGGTALGEHFGEKITPLPNLELSLQIYPKSSDDPQKTKNAYTRLDMDLCGKNTKKTQNIIKALKEGDIKSIKENLHNDFETLGQPHFEEALAVFSVSTPSSSTPSSSTPSSSTPSSSTPRGLRLTGSGPSLFRIL